MSTPIVQAINSLGTVDSSLRPKAISNDIFKRSINKKLLLYLLNGLNKVKVDDYEFQTNEQARDPGYVTVATLVGDGTFTVSADDAKSLRVNMTLRKSRAVATYITTISTTTITPASITGISAGDKLALGATAMSESSARPDAISRVPEVAVNYVQTQRDVVAASDFSQNTFFYGGPRFFQNYEMMMDEHGVYIDKQLIFGVKTSTTYGGKQIYHTGGLFNQITTNVRAFPNGRLTYRHALDLIATDTRLAQSMTMWNLCSNKGAALWSALAHEHRMDIETKEQFGLNITSILVGSKTLKLIPIDHLNATSDLENTQIIVDPALLEIVTVQNQKTKQRVWMQEAEIKGRETETGTDADTREVKSAFGLRLKNQEAHSVWTDVADVEAA